MRRDLPAADPYRPNYQSVEHEGEFAIDLSLLLGRQVLRMRDSGARLELGDELLRRVERQRPL